MWRAFVVVLCCWLGWMPQALAQGDNVDAARAAEAAARDAFRKKEYLLAAEGFAAAFRLDPKANTKYNEALAWTKAGESAAAADAYEAALTFGGLGDDLTTKGTDELAALKNKLGRLVVNTPLGAKVSVAHARERGVPTKIHLAPGQHEVAAKLADGSEQMKTVTVVAGADVELIFEGPAAKPDPVPEPDPIEPPVTPKDDNAGMVIAGWTLVGLGAAALIGMGVTGGLTLSKVSKYDDTGNTDVELHDEAVMLKTTTNVLVAVGGGLVATGIVLLIVATVGGDDEAAIDYTPGGFSVRF